MGLYCLMAAKDGQARGRIWSIARIHLPSRGCGKAGKGTHQREPDEAPFLSHAAHGAPFAAPLLERY